MSSINLGNYTGGYNKLSAGSNDIFTNMNMTAGTSFISDMALIKNGTYKRLAKGYYTKQDKEETEAVEADTKKLTLAKNSAEQLKKAAEALKDRSLYDGSDRDKLVEAVKTFVNAYNDTVNTADDVETNVVLRNTLHMINSVSSNGSLLSDIGIKIGKDNNLSMDEETLKKANSSTLKSVLAGSGSVADKVSQRASGIVNAVSNATGTYTRTAAHSNTVSLSVSNMLDTEI